MKHPETVAIKQLQNIYTACKHTTLLNTIKDTFPLFLSLHKELLLKYNVYCLCYCKTFIHSATHSFMFWWKGDLFLFRY